MQRPVLSTPASGVGAGGRAGHSALPPLPPNRLPRRVCPLPPVDDQPTAGAPGGLLHQLQRLRITPNGAGHLLGFSVVQRAAPPRGVRTPADEALRPPAEGARIAPALLRRRRHVVEAAAQAGLPAAARPADRTAHSRASARAYLNGLFPADGNRPCCSRAGLVDRLMRYSTLETPPHEVPVLVGCVLAGQTGGSSATAHAILDGLNAARPCGPAFAAQCALACGAGPGIDCLLALAPPRQPLADPYLEAIWREAFTTRLRAAARMCERLPLPLRPDSIDQCVALAREMVRFQAGQGLMYAAAARHLAPDLLLAQALLCADALLADPAAEVAAPELQQAYLAVRNGIVDAAALADIRERLNKFNTCIRRAAARGPDALVQDLLEPFGLRKNPLGARARLGTAQYDTRHPEDDMARRCLALNVFVQRVGEQLALQTMGMRPDEATLRKAVRVALVRHWKRRIVERGWKDTRVIGARARRAVAREVAAQLGCPLATVLQHRSLSPPPRLFAGLLEIWAVQEGLDLAAPAAPGDTRCLDEALRDFRGLQCEGDPALVQPTEAQARALLVHALTHTRQTYSTSFTSGGNLGVVAALGSLLAATPVFGGAGPGAGVVLSHNATLQLGSNVHGPLCLHTSQYALHLEGGGSAFLGKQIEGMLNVGVTASLLPLVFDHFRSRGAGLRARMDPIRPDGVAPVADDWREVLLDAVRALTWEEGGQGLPADAAAAWRQLARRFYKNPNLSIDGVRNRQTSLSANAAATVGARAVVLEGAQAGPQGSLGLVLTYYHRFRQRDTGGGRLTRQHTAGASRGGVATVAFTGQAPGITGGAIQANAGQAGTAQSLLVSAANFGSASWSFLRGHGNVTIRMVVEQGRVDANFTVMDTELGSGRRFAAYIDGRRDAWLEALGGGAEAAHRLDTFLTRAVAEDTQTNVTFGERCRLTPRAARLHDHYHQWAELLAAAPGAPTRRARAEIARLRGEAARVLDDAHSWDPRSLWVLHLCQSARTAGPTVVVQAYGRQTVTAARQNMMLVATEAPQRQRDLEAEF